MHYIGGLHPQVRQNNLLCVLTIAWWPSSLFVPHTASVESSNKVAPMCYAGAVTNNIEEHNAFNYQRPTTSELDSRVYSLSLTPIHDDWDDGDVGGKMKKRCSRHRWFGSYGIVPSANLVKRIKCPLLPKRKSVSKIVKNLLGVFPEKALRSTLRFITGVVHDWIEVHDDSACMLESGDELLATDPLLPFILVEYFTQGLLRAIISRVALLHTFSA